MKNKQNFKCGHVKKGSNKSGPVARLKLRDYYIKEPKGKWQNEFSKAEKKKFRPIAESLAMLDGNAFFGSHYQGKEHYEAYLPEAKALYESNGGDKMGPNSFNGSFR